MTTATKPRPATDLEIENPLHRLTPEQIEAIGREFDELHDQVKSELGDRDARYIRGIIALHRRLALLGRALLIASRFRPAWMAGTATLSLAKILENMEIGHNVLHGQWDWMNDPVINSQAWDWDTASTAEAWRHSHNYIHHTYTNIRGKDKDLGYEIMRIDPHQRWHPVYLLQPLYNVLLMALFEWGVAFHDLDLDAIRSGEKSKEQLRKELKGIFGKARLQIVKDYVAWPLISAVVMTAIEAGVGAARPRTRRARLKSRLRREERFDFVTAARRTYTATVLADVTANVVRNVWAHAIIFCGHFPDQTYTFGQKEV
ncbi:MAG: fatty acid desaturase family protein, partial [Thermoleophilaceae bacterium]